MQRPVGVSVPQGQQQVADAQQTRGQPKQLLLLKKIDTYHVVYTDNTGAVHSGLCHYEDGTVYIHPNDERWAAGVKQAVEWLTKDVRDQIAIQLQDVVAAQMPVKPMIDITPPKASPLATKQSVDITPPRVA